MPMPKRAGDKLGHLFLGDRPVISEAESSFVSIKCLYEETLPELFKLGEIRVQASQACFDNRCLLAALGALQSVSWC
jgi:hypothetical protein